MNIEVVKDFVGRARAAQGQVNEILIDVYGRRTPEEIEELKAQWLADPAWDIEDTEGFEAHEAELAEFHREWRRQWQLERDQKDLKRCSELGCSPQMLAHLEFLQSQIDYLSKEVNKLRGYD